MRILTCISVVPDTTAKIAFNGDNTKLEKSGIQFIINPYDELALAKALELSPDVTVIHVGEADSEAVIRKALAIGATNAIRIDAEATDAMFVAEQIVKHAKDENYDLILTGKESIDYNGSQVPAILGAMLDLTVISGVNSLTMDGKTLEMDQEIEGGKRKVKANLPLIVGASRDIAEPKLPNMMGIMKARSKPLNVIAADSSSSHTEYIKFEHPKAKPSIKYVDANNMDELVNLLKNEAKVI